MKRNGFYIVGLGASAGGHQSLSEFFQHLPEEPGAAFVVVTHLLRDHFSILDRIISKHTRMTVVRMNGADIIRPNHVYVMPENVKVHVKNGTLFLTPREADEVLNKAIDLFFQSLGKDQRDKAIGIVFSGMGSDGFEGVQTIHQHGGMVLVQDPRSTDFKGMPETIINRDNPDVVLPPADLASELISLIHEKQSVARS
jgi:two-component system, chemotaxis family, protein-glutamate methylesterase/glutaminase